MINNCKVCQGKSQLRRLDGLLFVHNIFDCTPVKDTISQVAELIMSAWPAVVCGRQLVKWWCFIRKGGPEWWILCHGTEPVTIIVHVHIGAPNSVCYDHREIVSESMLWPQRHRSHYFWLIAATAFDSWRKLYFFVVEKLIEFVVVFCLFLLIFNKSKHARGYYNKRCLMTRQNNMQILSKFCLWHNDVRTDKQI